MAARSTFAPGRWLTPAEGYGYRLSPSAEDALREVLARLRIDPARPRIVVGYTAAASAFVVGRHVVLHRGRWHAMGTAAQLGLLAHELVHVAQYAALGPAGTARFLARYLPEYHLNPDNYRLPDTLAACSLADVDLLDRRYTLDQIAERFRRAVLEAGCADP